MDAARAERARRAFDQFCPNPNQLAERFARRAVTEGVIPEGVPGMALARKTRNVAATLSLVVKNADLLDSIQTVMDRGTVPAFLPSVGPEFAEGVRACLLHEIWLAAGIAGVEWNAEVESDWRAIIQVVADSTFGQTDGIQRRVA